MLYLVVWWGILSLSLHITHFLYVIGEEVQTWYSLIRTCSKMAASILTCLKNSCHFFISGDHWVDLHSSTSKAVLRWGRQTEYINCLTNWLLQPEGSRMAEGTN